ncbi:MAG: hypothetical protein HON68_08780 [Gammaproteobacteria bacterium]|jgi:hypothetical protein|nr:hypothetical protein [Gammaproteobacteria bacterium]MBT3489113.1 hypothetical protein [Gammaproteobacteria bacterium]MBT3718902.1 hypothetical protein [Gammaproteobacteria bacterium]MBT3845217.1 hypothetical protein [Gammaproteobacteria bacterium]MBT3892239.1 hypothetical protein [Gammaproteobacteria bacterium]
MDTFKKILYNQQHGYEQEFKTATITILGLSYTVLLFDMVTLLTTQ